MTQRKSPIPDDIDPAETAEWLESLDYVLESKGPERVGQLLAALDETAYRNGVELPFTATTPYINTIPADRTPPYPGQARIGATHQELCPLERDGHGDACQQESSGAGRSHFDICKFCHAVRGSAESLHSRPRGIGLRRRPGLLPGACSAGNVCARLSRRAISPSRTWSTSVANSAKAGGLSSYPHPWLMPDFWEFPTVSMGLGPIMAIYQARFNEYLSDRGIIDVRDKRVWAFLGDGECDEPETLGAITLAAREHLDNLTFVINCNLQRLDGPVRGNGKIIQELEGAFRGAGWNVIKVIWGSDWDPLLEDDESGILARTDDAGRRRRIPKIRCQRRRLYSRALLWRPSRNCWKWSRTIPMRNSLSLKRGGHDPEKVYAAMKAAAECKGRPTVILAKTIKGYGLGEGGEGRNITHNQKKLNEQELREFRSRFGIPISDERVAEAPFLSAARGEPGNAVPPQASRCTRRLCADRGSISARNHGGAATCRLPEVARQARQLRDPTSRCRRRWDSSACWAICLRDKKIGKHIVPIVPDESRTFGMEGLFRQVGIYAHTGQLYEPVDSDQLAYLQGSAGRTVARRRHHGSRAA